MTRLSFLYLKADITKYAANNDLTITTLNDETFLAQGPGCMIHIPMNFIVQSIENGWTLEEVLQNEMNHVEEGA